MFNLPTIEAVSEQDPSRIENYSCQVTLLTGGTTSKKAFLEKNVSVETVLLFQIQRNR